MSEIIHLIKKYAPVDCRIALHLKNDSTIEGTIIEITDLGVVVQISGKVRLVRSDSILEFEVLENSFVADKEKQPTNDLKESPEESSEQTNLADVPIPQKETTSDKKYKEQEATVVPEHEIKKQEKIPPFAFSAFQAPPSITLPPVDFKIKDLIKEDQQDLSRIKSKYEHACKIKEMNRINDLLPEVLRFSERLKSSNVYYIAGFIALAIDKFPIAKSEFQKACLTYNEKALLGLARICVVEKKWEEAVQWLIQLFFHDEEREENINEKEILISIGSCLTHCVDKELRGLAEIQSKLITEEGKYLYHLLLAYALKEKYPESAEAAYNGDVIEASKMAMASAVFQPIKAPVIEPIPQPIKHTSSAKNETTLLGYITAVYPEKGYGYINSNDQEPFFFPISNITDYELKHKLLSNISGEKVSFYRDIDPDNKRGRYDVAKKITWVDSDKEKNPISSPFIALPKGNKSYSSAKIAEQNGEFEKAESLFRSVIAEKGKYSQSAVKDLAQLLNRLNRGEDAIKLLDEHRTGFEDKKALDNLKTQFYIKLGKYEEAAKLLRQLKQQSSSAKESLNYLRQEATCMMMYGDIDHALKIVREAQKKAPYDEQLSGFIDKLESFKKQKFSSDYEELLSLAGFKSSLSKFPQDLIRFSDFTGVDERAKVRGYFVSKDFKEVDINLDRMGGRRPKDKAKLLITLAAMAERSPESAGNKNPSQLIGRALAFMGEAATYDGVHPDVRRFYLLEALALPRDDRSFKFPISFLIATYLPEIPEPGEFISENDYDLNIVLGKLEFHPKSLQSFIDDMYYFETIDKHIVEYLLKLISKNFPHLNKLLPSDKLRENKSDSILDLQRKTKADLRSLIDKNYLNSADFDETSAKLLELKDSMLFELDKNRILELSNITSDVARYWNEQDYIEKESRCSRLMHELNHLIDDISHKPTKISYEHILELGRKLRESIKHDFNEYSKKAIPQIELVNVLSDDFYVLVKDTITLRLEVFLKKGSAPIEGVDVNAVEEDGILVLHENKAPFMLKGGERKEIELTIKPTIKYIQEQVFTVRCYVSYRNRQGESEKSKEFSLPIRLGNSSSFTEIMNPYQHYAGGKSVEDPFMFKGRQEILERIVNVVTEGSNGQCFVLYGQKRSGKTSILHQIKRRLNKDCVSILLSFGEIDIDYEKKQVNFIELCADKLNEYFEDELNLSINIPAKNEIKEYPNESFKKIFRDGTKLLKSNGFHAPKIILLIDEFTYVYEYIKEGIVAPTFMRTWKALLQLQMFNAVVVGQDSMPKFKQEFPNEFGVTHDERISYLSYEETKALAEEPILYDGTSRFRGHAFERLFQLTAGSPFYTNIICDRLVRYLNTKKSSFITEADIDNVLYGWKGDSNEMSGLVLGSDIMPIERFDPLITAAGESVKDFTREEYLGILMPIAEKRNNATVRDLPQGDKLNLILKDMQEREVIQSVDAQHYKISVGLFAEWLKCNQVLAG
ncbi:hypothetical protein WDW89_08465 [Deltaproteobacteria bacterium TL4]